MVDSRESERAALDKFFVEHRNNSDEPHLTVLTTLQRNFACDYCLQGDHDEYNKSGTKMSLDTAYRVCDWLVERLDTVKPRKLTLTFFGGEPLLNLEVLYAISERAHKETQERGVEVDINVITNGLLLTPPRGCRPPQATRPQRVQGHVGWRSNDARPDTSAAGGAATFDKIIENIR